MHESKGGRTAGLPDDGFEHDSPLPAVRPQRTPAPVSRRRRAPELPAPALESPATGA